jgi:hypothetical protein
LKRRILELRVLEHIVQQVGEHDIVAEPALLQEKSARMTAC